MRNQSVSLFARIGFLTRPMLVAVIINMYVATAVMFPKGFLGPGGAFYPFMFLIIALVILLTVPMEISIDYLIIKKEKQI